MTMTALYNATLRRCCRGKSRKNRVGIGACVAVHREFLVDGSAGFRGDHRCEQRVSPRIFVLVRLPRIPESDVLFAWITRFVQKAQRTSP